MLNHSMNCMICIYNLWFRMPEIKPPEMKPPESVPSTRPTSRQRKVPISRPGSRSGSKAGSRPSSRSSMKNGHLGEVQEEDGDDWEWEYYYEEDEEEGNDYNTIKALDHIFEMLLGLLVGFRKGHLGLLI